MTEQEVSVRLTENDERVLQGSMLTGDTNGILKNANDPTAVLQLYQLEQQALRFRPKRFFVHFWCLRADIFPL